MRDYQYFRADELRCKCGSCDGGSMDDGFMGCLIAMRQDADFPFSISSGFRCPTHNQAVSNTGAGGPHTTGQAADIRCYGAKALRVIELALRHGMTGIGVNQKGPFESRYIHVDLIVGHPNRPWVWSY